MLEDRCEFETRRRPPAGETPRNRLPRIHGRPHIRDIRPSGGPRRRRQRIEPVAEAVEGGLFADFKNEQRLVEFKDITPERLLQRYNVALAQSVLLRAVGVEVYVRREPPVKLRRLFRLIKFHRLVCDVESTGPDAYRFKLDGPLSLFTATQK